MGHHEVSLRQDCVAMRGLQLHNICKQQTPLEDGGAQGLCDCYSTHIREGFTDLELTVACASSPSMRCGEEMLDGQ